MEPFRPEGVNLPNVMTPGAWVLVSIIIAAILSGFVFMFFKYWTKIRVPWNKLVGFYDGRFYEEPGNPSFSIAKLVAALRKTEELLKTYTKWTPDQILAVLQKVHVYVKKDPAWVDQWGRKVAGEEGGKVIAVGSDFAALLHETGHLLEEIIDKEIDNSHVTWGPKGLDAADVEFQKWLKTVP